MWCVRNRKLVERMGVRVGKVHEKLYTCIYLFIHVDKLCILMVKDTGVKWMTRNIKTCLKTNNFLLIEIWNYEAINVFCMMKERLLFLQLSWSHSPCNCIFNDFPNLLKYDMNYKISFFFNGGLIWQNNFLKNW